jgi:putative DNA-invertase from lambdoid prophage Rac
MPSRRETRAAIYARVSTHDQQTLPLQIAALRKYARQRGWTITREVRDIGSGATTRPRREEILELARRREIDVVIVWRLDRWGRSMADLALSLEDLRSLGVGFASVTEAVDLTTPTGRAMAGLLSVFAEFEREILRERVKAGIARAKEEGKLLGRPRTAARHRKRIQQLLHQGLSKSAIARELGISRTSVRRLQDASSLRIGHTRNKESSQS